MRTETTIRFEDTETRLNDVTIEALDYLYYILSGYTNDTRNYDDQLTQRLGIDYWYDLTTDTFYYYPDWHSDDTFTPPITIDIEDQTTAFYHND